MSLCDVPSIFPTLPVTAKSTRLAVFYSPAAILNAQLSIATRQIRVLEAESASLKDSIKLLFKKNTTVVDDLENLRTQVHGLTSKNTQLEKEKEMLTTELRSERVKCITSTRKAQELLFAIKQRDAFVRAMIDINLHQHVLKDAYFSVEAGCSIDEAIVSAILSAASNPVSPWSRILTPPDVTKSDLYKCAIELAAAARLRTDKSVQAAQYWRHVAKCDPKNSDLLTPSPSQFDGMDKDKDIRREERTDMLDGLLDKLRAGENIRTREEEQKFVVLTPEPILKKSPASAFFELFQTKGRAPTRSDLSLATMSSWNSDFMAPLSSSRPVDKSALCDIAKPHSHALSSSLERIREIFSTSSIASSLDHGSVPSASVFEDSFSSVYPPFRPATSFVTGRGRSATVPFSARDLSLLPVKNVVSRLPTVTAPGDEVQEVQALAGQRVRFNKQIPLMRSKAIKASRPRTFGTNDTVPISTKVILSYLSFIENPLVEIKLCFSFFKQIGIGLPTPPAEMDSICYVRPPTVMRKKGTDTPQSDASPTASSFDVSGKPSFTSASSSSFPFGCKIRPCIRKNPSPQHRKVVVISSSDSLPPQKRSIPKQPDPPSKLRLGNISSKQRSSVTLVRPSSSSSNKENIPPRSCKSILTTPIRSTFGSSRIPTRSPPSVHHVHKVPMRVNASTPTHLSVATKRVSDLEPVQPLRIMKKIRLKKSSVQATGSNSLSQCQRILQPQSNISN